MNVNTNNILALIVGKANKRTLDKPRPRVGIEIIPLFLRSGNSLGIVKKCLKTTEEMPFLYMKYRVCILLSTLSACWAFSLAPWNFYFQNYLSPFSTWVNCWYIHYKPGGPSWEVCKIQVITFTLRSVLSLNNPQNIEMNFCKKYEVDMLKIIIIIIAYTLNNFNTHVIIS